MNSTETCIVIAATLGLVLSGCEKKPKTVDVSDGGAPRANALNPALARAVKAAAKHKSDTEDESGQPGGPPPHGVFAAGRADKLMPKGAPPKITLGSQGGEPRVDLTAMQPKPGFAKKASVEFTLQNGGRGVPPLDFMLDVSAKKAPAPQGKPAVNAAAPVQMVVRIDAAKFNSGMAVNVPAEVEQALAKLRGSHVDYDIAANGAGSALHYTLAKNAPQLDEVILRSLSEGFATLALPYPDKPVGKGAFWMATTRETVAGVDVVAYHLVKVDSVDGDKAELNIDTKRYAADNQIDTSELPPGLGQVKLTDFEAESNGTLDIVKGTSVPVGGELQQVLQAGLSASAKPGQKLGLQSQSKFVFMLAK
jgi:hypothetical protein